MATAGEASTANMVTGSTVMAAPSLLAMFAMGAVLAVARTGFGVFAPLALMADRVLSALPVMGLGGRVMAVMVPCGKRRLTRKCPEGHEKKN